MLEKSKAFTNGNPIVEPAYSHYLTERGYWLRMLSYLPSLETMEVLCAFLDDTDRPSGEPGDIGYFNTLALTCTTTLKELVQDLPGQGYYEAEWREWRDEIRAGKRTFRFKGSDIRYNFDGPVLEKAPRIHKPLPSPDGSEPGPSETRDASPANSGPTSPRSRRIIIACSALLLLLAVARLLSTKRKPAAPPSKRPGPGE